MYMRFALNNFYILKQTLNDYFTTFMSSKVKFCLDCIELNVQIRDSSDSSEGGKRKSFSRICSSFEFFAPVYLTRVEFF